MIRKRACSPLLGLISSFCQKYFCLEFWGFSDKLFWLIFLTTPISLTHGWIFFYICTVVRYKSKVSRSINPTLLSNLFGNILDSENRVKIISDSRIRSIIAKGPKYRFPVQIDFQKCHEKIAGSLNEFCNRWCKREHVALLFYVHGKHLRSCRDGQLT